MSDKHRLHAVGRTTVKTYEPTAFVVPRSGTGELKGLSGEGGFNAELRQDGAIWLDYNLEPS
jgi:hypothetical protein